MICCFLAAGRKVFFLDFTWIVLFIRVPPFCKNYSKRTERFGQTKKAGTTPQPFQTDWCLLLASRCHSRSRPGRTLPTKQKKVSIPPCHRHSNTADSNTNITKCAMQETCFAQKGSAQKTIYRKIIPQYIVVVNSILSIFCVYILLFQYKRRILSSCYFVSWWGNERDTTAFINRGTTLTLYLEN